jgi:hypothetical protein
MSDASADPFLAVGLAILMFLMLIINVYIYVYWQHPEDKNESMLPKVVIIFGLQVTAVSVLLIPIGKFFLLLLLRFVSNPLF